MRNQPTLLTLLLVLPLLLLFGQGAAAQSGRDPQRELSITFEARHEGQDAGEVFGTIVNRSANSYPCVRIEFDLFTRFDLRQPGQPTLPLGVLAVEVRGLQPRTVRGYQQQLPFPAGIGLKSIGECSVPPPVTRAGVMSPASRAPIVILPVTTPSPPVLQQGRYTIQQKSSGRWVDAYPDRKDFAAIARPTADYIPKFGNLIDLPVWEITPVGNGYTIKQLTTGRFLDAHEIAEKGFAVVTRPRQSDETQTWILVPLGKGVFTIQQRSSGRYLDAHRTAAQDYALFTSPAVTSDSQRWILTEFFPEG